MEKLFEVPEAPQRKETCRTCKHRQRWEFNTKVFQYCGIRTSKYTNNGLLKIKCKTKACGSYEAQ